MASDWRWTHVARAGNRGRRAIDQRQRRFAAALRRHAGSVIGVTLALPDGTLARSGGKVVKNVAGYDLPKLATGCAGNAGHDHARLFSPASLAARNARTLSIFAADLAEMQHCFLPSRTRRLAPSALQVRLSASAPAEIDILFEGTPPGLRGAGSSSAGSGRTASGDRKRRRGVGGAPASLVFAKTEAVRESQHAAGGDRDGIRRRASSYVRASRGVERRGAGHRLGLLRLDGARKPCTCRCRNCARARTRGRFARRSYAAPADMRRSTHGATWATRSR